MPMICLVQCPITTVANTSYFGLRYKKLSWCVEGFVFQLPVWLITQRSDLENLVHSCILEFFLGLVSTAEVMYVVFGIRVTFDYESCYSFYIEPFLCAFHLV